MRALCGLVLGGWIAAALVLPPRAANGPPRPPRRVALLIGIGDYRYFLPVPPPPTKLAGPIHDVELMRQVLREKEFVGDDDVRVLTDSAASREGIAAGFRWLAERANDTSDVVVVFYSGHGSNAPDRNGDEARVMPGDVLDEALVPWEARDIHDPDQLVIDDQIEGWLRAIRSRNVTVIVDACHSGTFTRWAGFSGFPRPRGPSGNVSAGSQLLDRRDALAHTLITAAAANELAWEGRFGDRGLVYGVFTYHFARALRAARRGTHYDEILRQVTAEIRSAGWDQTPQLEGDRSALLFRVGEGVARRPFDLVTQAVRGRASIDAGAVHGVRRFAVYDLYPPGETAFRGADRLGQLRVDSVEELRAWGALLEVDSVAPGSRVTLARVPHGARSPGDVLSVFVGADSRVRRAVDSLPFVAVTDDPTRADAAVRSEGGVVLILVGGDTLPPPSDYRSDWVRRGQAGGRVLKGYALSAAALCRPLRRALAIAILRVIENPQSPPPEVLGVEVALVVSDSPPAPRPAGVDTAYIGRAYDLWVRVSATESSTMYLAAAIEGYGQDPVPFYPQSDSMPRPVALRVWVRVLQGIHPTEPPGPEVVRFYVGSEQYDFRTLLSSIPDTTCELRRRAAFDWPPPEPVVGWTAVEHRIVVRRPPATPGGAGGTHPR